MPFFPTKWRKRTADYLMPYKPLPPGCKQEKILLDFELVPVNALQKHHPASMLSGCYFHLTLKFDRKMGELGSKKLVSENHEVALALEMIPALAFKK